MLGPVCRGLLYGAHLPELDRAAELGRLPSGLATSQPAAYYRYVRQETSLLTDQPPSGDRPRGYPPDSTARDLLRRASLDEPDPSDECAVGRDHQGSVQLFGPRHEGAG